MAVKEKEGEREKKVEIVRKKRSETERVEERDEQAVYFLFSFLCLNFK